MTPTVSAILAIQLNTLGIPIEGENARFVPTAGVTYLREQMLGFEQQHRPIRGGAANNDIGLWEVTVMAPKDGTRTPGRVIAQRILDAFPPGWRGSRDGVTVAVRKCQVGPSFVSGDRFVVPVTVYWTAT